MDESVRKGSHVMVVFGNAGETVCTALIATFVTLVLTTDMPPGVGGAWVGVLVVGAIVFAAMMKVGIHKEAERAQSELAGTARAAQLQDITLATSDVLAEQADVMAELRALRAEVAELRRPWWRRWGR